MESTITVSEVPNAETLNQVNTSLNREIQKLQDAFALLGWHNLPERLKTVIAHDVSMMIDELEGRYCTIDTGIERRRKQIRYWIDCYQQGICSSKTAIRALSNHSNRIK